MRCQRHPIGLDPCCHSLSHLIILHQERSGITDFPSSLGISQCRERHELDRNTHRLCFRSAGIGLKPEDGQGG
ncbi:hypothetical protein AA3266_1948 [Gluconobacter kondonii NBRC 3266]|nr:hypothetical protein AA3266_1948 [Gluconobacter kondonii NBRC 3266]